MLNLRGQKAWRGEVLGGFWIYFGKKSRNRPVLTHPETGLTASTRTPGTKDSRPQGHRTQTVFAYFRRWLRRPRTQNGARARLSLPIRLLCLSFLHVRALVKRDRVHTRTHTHRRARDRGREAERETERRRRRRRRRKVGGGGGGGRFIQS